METENTKVISLGGSLIHPDGIDTQYLNSFKDSIEKRISDGERFIFICGGGMLARKAQDALRATSNPPQDYYDWVGIMATRLNAEVVRAVFNKYSYGIVVTDPTKFPKTDKEVVVASGWKPGWSTDYVSCVIAKEIGIKTVYNLSNVDYVYTDDPRKNKDAKKIEKIDWAGFRKIVGDEWVPGKNAPFDPVASKYSQEHGLKVIFLKGKDIANMQNCFDGKKFDGTIIY